jgi:hypothetical protein
VVAQLQLAVYAEEGGDDDVGGFGVREDGVEGKDVGVEEGCYGGGGGGVRYVDSWVAWYWAGRERDRYVEGGIEWMNEGLKERREEGKGELNRHTSNHVCVIRTCRSGRGGSELRAPAVDLLMES